MSCFCRRCCTSGIHPDGVKSRTRGQKGESRRTVQAPMSGSPAVCRKQNIQLWGKPKEVRGGQDGSVSGCWWPLRICPAYPAVSYRLGSIHYQDCLWWDEEADENGLYFFMTTHSFLLVHAIFAQFYCTRRNLCRAQGFCEPLNPDYATMHPHTTVFILSFSSHITLSLFYITWNTYKYWLRWTY